MIYDEKYFPFGRVRLISEMEIPFRDLTNGLNSIILFVANLLTTFNYLKESYGLLNQVFNDIRTAEAHNHMFVPISESTKNLSIVLKSPTKKKRKRLRSNSTA